MKRALAGLAIVGALTTGGCGHHHPAPQPTPSPTTFSVSPTHTVPPVVDPTTTVPLPTAPSRSSMPTQTPTVAAVKGGITCKDGSVSHATNRRGACSHHGGVA